MEAQLESVLVSKIKECYNESQRLAEAAKEHVAGAVAKATECGHFLRESKIATGAHWQEWFLAQGFEFKPEAAKRLMRLADASLNRELNKEDLLAIGMLPEKIREEGDQHRSPQLACQWLTMILKATSAINHAREQSPLEEWPDAHRATLKEKLRPLVELYATL